MSYIKSVVAKSKIECHPLFEDWPYLALDYIEEDVCFICRAKTYKVLSPADILLPHHYQHSSQCL